MSAPGRKLSVIMPVMGIHHCPGDFATVCCLQCDQHLGLTQPETEEPARLIGTCDHCGRWYLLDWHPGSLEGLMLLLPDHAELIGFFPKLDPTETRPEGDG